MTGPFTMQLQEFARKTGAKADLAVGKIVVEIYRELDQRSPVGDATYWKNPAPKGYVGGHFRKNWQYGNDNAPSGVIAGADPSGSEVQGRIIAAIPEQASGKVHYLVNNTVYGPRIENGWSRQAPQGLVGLTVIGWQGKVDRIVAGLAA